VEETNVARRFGGKKVEKSMKLCQVWKIVAGVCALVPACALGGESPTTTLAQNDGPRAVNKKTEDGKSGPPALKKFTIRVLDRDGNPVAGAHVGLGAHLGTQDEPKKPDGTDADG